MASPYDYIPDDIKKAAAESGMEKNKIKDVSLADKHLAAGTETKQRRIFKKKRAGVVLSREEVRAIKAGRKKLRRELKQRGIKSKREFELIAGDLGLYFDKRSALLAWLLSHWLGVLLGLLLAFLCILFIFSMVQKLRGHFTVSLSDGMFKEGFTLSETEGFENPTVQLFATPAQDVPCISINQIPSDIDEVDGEHNDVYFAYTYYIRNEGESTVGYEWSLSLNSETQRLSDAAWLAVFEDGKPRIYAKANTSSGEAEALPPKDDNTRGYLNLPIRELAGDSEQFEKIKQDGQLSYWRVIPEKFISDELIAAGEQEHVGTMDVHKYTVVIWLEGDDADTDDSKIGGNLGVEMNFRLVSESEK